jgi:hypothetical protein
VDVDTYGAVLLGLRDCLPNTSPTLTELTDAAGGRLEERVKLSEVRRVSKEMNKKAEAVRRGGDPAIDFVASTPERVTIVDPYLAFIIAWGMSTFGLPTLH